MFAMFPVGVSQVLRFCLLWSSLLLATTNANAQQDIEGLPLWTPENWASRYDSYPDFEKSQINALYRSKDSTIWVFNGLGVYEISDYKQVPNKLSQKKITRPIIHRHQDIYYFRENELFCIKVEDIKNKPDSLEFLQQYKLKLTSVQRNKSNEKIPEKIPITCMVVDEQESMIWVGTNQCGLFAIRQPRSNTAWDGPILHHYYNTISRRDSNNVLLDNTVKTLYRDKNGTIWIAFRNGLMRMKDRKPEKVLRYIDISDIAENHLKQQLWVTGRSLTTHKNCTAVFDLSAQPPLEDPVLPPVPVWKIANAPLLSNSLFDAAGDWWIAGRHYIFRGKEYGRLDNIEELENRFNQDWPHSFGYWEGFTSRQPLSMVEGKKGFIWVGTGDQGLYYIQKKPGIGVRLDKMVPCHDDKKGQITVKALEGTPPFQLVWESKRNGAGTIPDFRSHQFEPKLAADTFEFWLTDKWKKDIGYYRFTRLNNPPKLRAEITHREGPIYEDASNGEATVKASGGRVNLDNINKKHHYNYRWSNKKSTGEHSNGHLSLGAFSVTVTDTVGCEVVLKDSLPYPQHFSKDAWDCQIVVGDKFNMKQILFDAAKSEVSAKYAPLLEDVAAWMKTHPSIRIEVGGHTQVNCKDTKSETCIQLSQHRADNVKKILVEKGVAAERIQTKGYGRLHPYTTADDKLNQRTEIKVIACDPIEIKKQCIEKGKPPQKSQ